MPRVKISEYTAKKTIFSALNQPYTGLSLILGKNQSSSNLIRDLASQFPNQNLVLKVDQGIKKRGKTGLLKLNLTPSDIPPIIKKWQKQGWNNFLVEPVIEHAPDAEHYLAIERIRAGWQISYSARGGIDVESSWDKVKVFVVPSSSDLSAIRNEVKDRSELAVLDKFLSNLLPLLETHHLVFLEMNPILIRGNLVIPLDMACEADSVGTTLPTLPDRNLASCETAIAKLDATTPASLKFKLINSAGRIWVLLSGGGASLVLADEVADQGMGQELANYGEYSGAPTDDDVYSYTKIILAQLLQNQAKQTKALVIAAGIANFTDVAKTFKGIIRALKEVSVELKKSKVKVFVRRGGPNESKGLHMMATFLTQAKIPHIIHPHQIPLTQVISDVKGYLS